MHDDGEEVVEDPLERAEIGHAVARVRQGDRGRQLLGALFLFLEQRAIRQGEIAFLERPLDVGPDVLEIVERLLQVVVRATPNGMQRGIGRGVAGHDQDLGVRVLLLDLGQELDPVLAGEHDVEQSHFGLPVLELRDRLFRRAGLANLAAVHLQDAMQHVPDRFLVVDDEDSGLVHGGLRRIPLIT